MKTSSLLKNGTILMLLFFTACDSDDISPTYDLTGGWTVIAFNDYAKLKKTTKSEQNTWMDFNNGDITISFGETDSEGKGEFSGVKVTNGYFGTYSIPAKGKISIDSFGQTFINEPEWTELFHINKAETYEVRNQTLKIYYNKGKNSITFKKS